MDIRERETLALLAAQTEFQVEIPKMETIQPIITYPLEMNPLTWAEKSRISDFEVWGTGHIADRARNVGQG